MTVFMKNSLPHNSTLLPLTTELAVSL